MPRKPNPFVVALNQPGKGPHLHGKHRRTSPTTHSDPSDGAGAGAGAQGGSSIWSVTWGPPSTGIAPSASTYARGGGKSITLADYAKMMAMIPTFGFGTIKLEEPKPPTIPYAGIRSGEIIGHRAWWVLGDGLYSVAHRFRWEPGATIEGDVNKVVQQYAFIWGGIYAYHDVKDPNYIKYFQYLKDAIENRYIIFDDSHALGLALGTVKLWGEVIEHELGWRAQFAKLHSIDQWWGDPSVNEILEPYRASLAI